jgi:hypothetical protein
MCCQVVAVKGEWDINRLACTKKTETGKIHFIYNRSESSISVLQEISNNEEYQISNLGTYKLNDIDSLKGKDFYKDLLTAAKLLGL